MALSAINLDLVEKHPFRELLKLAGPLILSMSGLMIMQIVDGIMLSWYSPESLAAAGTAGFAHYGIICLFLGATGYAGIIAAHYMGAKRYGRIGPVIWQGLYLSIFASIILVGIGFCARPLFTLIGHAADVREMEITFFFLCCMGSIFPLMANALSAFFQGKGDTRTLMIVQILGFVINLCLDWLLIFGNYGFPRMGIVGAAVATISAQASIALIYGALFLGVNENRKNFATWSGRFFDIDLMKRLIRFGGPSGFRMAVEMLSWVAFFAFTGRIGTTELAASTIGIRINGVAFFPVVGLTAAMGIIIGTAQGQKRPDITKSITMKTFLISEIWMLIWVVLFLAIPEKLFLLFSASDGSVAKGVEFATISALGVVILKYIAAYCMLDAGNIVFGSALQSAGDTKWTFYATIIGYGIFIVALLFADHGKWGLRAEWLIAAIFAMSIALVWLFRFLTGKWRNIQVIEDFPEV